MALPLPKPEPPSPARLERPAREPEVIFRPVRGQDGELRIVQLPATLENLLNPRLEDQLTQSNDHLLVVVPLFDTLKRYLRRFAPHLAVFSDLLLKYKRHGHRDLTPDIAVVEGLPRELVDAYYAPGSKLDSLDVVAEGARLVFVMEVVSTSTADMRKKDEVSNPPLFATLGVRDHVLVYPPELGQPARLVARKLWAQGQYVPNLPSAQGRIPLDSVGLWLWVDEESRLPVFEHQATGERFLTAAQEECRADDAEYRAEVEKLRAEAEKQRAEAEKQRAEAEKQRADEAETLGHARALLAVLDARGFSLDADSHDRILGCRDLGQLALWTRRAVALEKLDDLWE